jgi:cobaltochelatase CobT
LREKQLGENHLILPIYYMEADEVIDQDHNDPIAKILASRNWSDWRQLRFRQIDSSEIESAISDMAYTIKLAMRDLEDVISASRVSTSSTPSSIPPFKVDVKTFSLDTPTFDQVKMDSDRGRVKGVYYSYTTQFDEVIYAKDLSSKGAYYQRS